MNFRYSLKLFSLLLCFLLMASLVFAQGQSGTSKAPTAGAAQKTVPPATAVPPARPAPEPAKPAQSATAPLMDINSATKQELMTLTGIGEALSQKIIDGRPYRAKNELTQKKIIPDATYDKIADKIIAKQASAAAAPAAGAAKATPATPATPAGGGAKATPATPATPAAPAVGASKAPASPPKGK